MTRAERVFFPAPAAFTTLQTTAHLHPSPASLVAVT